MSQIANALWGLLLLAVFALSLAYLGGVVVHLAVELARSGWAAV